MGVDRADKESKTRKAEKQKNAVPAGDTHESQLSSAASPAPNLSPANILRLQRVIGNHAVRQIVQDTESAPTSSHEIQPRIQTGLKTRASQPDRIQRFGGGEHKMFGDWGAGLLDNGGYNFSDSGSVTTADPGASANQPTTLHLSHGDITMLTGDYFPEDLLFDLAKKPSSDPGKQPGTHDEIIFAIYDNIPKDFRFTNGDWKDIEFSEDVKSVVKNRYLNRAAANDEHFANPEGNSFSMVTSQRGGSSGATYRSIHEDAILRAFEAGKNSGDIAEGMAYEAAADHFLTDSFSSGHVRTPRASIRDHWRWRYPNFFANFKKKIAYDVAYYMNENETNLATIAGTVNAIFGETHTQIDEKTADLPAFGFDDLIGRVAHDIDNEHGLWVTNDLGEHWKTYGDDMLAMIPSDPDDRTFEMGQLAVHLGIQDIQHAFELGKASPEIQDAEQIMQMVRAQTSSPAKPGIFYGAEQAMPRLDPNKENGTQNWQASSLEELWGMPVRTDLPMTYADAITENLSSGEIGKQLSAMASKFDPEKPVYKFKIYCGTLHPQIAYLNGFLQPLISGDSGEVLKGLQSIINFSPPFIDAENYQDDSPMPEQTDLQKFQQSIFESQQNGQGNAMPVPTPALPERLYFRFDRPHGDESLEEAIRSDQDLAAFRELAQWTTQVKDAEIELVGHASSEGPEYLNHNLGLARASSIELFLLNHGANLDHNKVVTDTKGEEGAEAQKEWRYVQITLKGNPVPLQENPSNP